jgi:adenylate cyclase class 2
MKIETTEIETKFNLPSIDDFHRNVLDYGGRLVQPRTLERNLRFDTPEGRLSATEQILRLRSDHKTTLTYKRSVHAEKRTEIQFELNDFDAAKNLLEALGFEVIFIYEKYRQIFQVGDVYLMIDELPFGTFVEIEGPSLESIKQAAHNLDLKWNNRITTNYLSLFERLRDHYKLTFRDATFANFNDRSLIRFNKLPIPLSPSNKDTDKP